MVDRECPSGHAGTAYVGDKKMERQSSFFGEPHKATINRRRHNQKSQPQPEVTSRRANTAVVGFFCFVEFTQQYKKRQRSCHETMTVNEKNVTSYVTKWSTRRAKSSFLYLKNKSEKYKNGLLGLADFLRSGLC